MEKCVVFVSLKSSSTSFVSDNIQTLIIMFPTQKIDNGIHSKS